MLISYVGTESFVLHEAAEACIRTLREQHGADVPVTRIDCTDADAAERLEQPLKYPSFFHTHHVVVATHAACPLITAAAKNHRIASATDITLVAIQDSEHPAYDKKSATTLRTAASEHRSFEVLSEEDRIHWATRFCADRGCEVSRPAIQLLIARIGSDLRALSHELEKVCAYVQRGRIEPAAIQLLAPHRTEYDEWELSNALAARNKRAIITTLWKRLHEGAAEQLLIGSIAAGMRNLAMVKELAGRGTPAVSIAKLAGLHPFVVSKTLRGAQATDADALRRAHIALATLDRSVKEGTAHAADELFSILLSW